MMLAPSSESLAPRSSTPLVLVFLIISAPWVFAEAPPTDRYPGPTYVSMEDVAAFRFESPIATDWSDSTGGDLLLTAPLGGERAYVLHLRAHDGGEVQASYTIDQSPPVAPLSDLPEGRYLGDREVSFSAFQSDGTERVFFAVNPGPNDRFSAWNGQPIPLTRNGARTRTVELVAYAEDSVGNRSEAAVYRYVLVDPDVSSYAPTARVRIVSPVAGSFRNRQPVIVLASSTDEVRYRISHAGATHSGIYEEPFLIEGNGTFSVTIEGYSDGARVFRESVSFRQDDEHTPAFGLVPEAIEITVPNDLPIAVSSDEPIVDARSPRSDGSVTLMPVYGIDTAAVVVVGVENPYRSAFILAGRPAETPGVYVGDAEDLPVGFLGRYLAEPTVLRAHSGDFVHFIGEPGSSVWYRRFAEESTEAWIRYDERIPVDRLIAGGGKSSVDIEFHARSSAGVAGPISLVSIETIPEPERVDVVVDGAFVRLAGEVSHALLATSIGETTEVAYVDISRRIDLGVPFGADWTVEVAAVGVPEGLTRSEALRLTAGAVFEPTREVRVDRRAPEPVAVTVDGTTVTLGGQDRILYRVRYATAEGARSLSYHVYEGPIDLPSTGVVGDAVVDTFQVDEAGNPGPSRSVSVGSFSLASDPIVAVDVDRSIEHVRGASVVFTALRAPIGTVFRYEIARSGDPAPEPTRESPQLPRRLLVEGEDGGETPISIAVRAFSVVENEPVGSAERFRYLLDDAPPTEPFVVGLDSPGPYLVQPIVSIVPAGDGERVFVAIGDEGEDDLDPFGTRGFEVAAPFVVETARGEESLVHLSYGVRDRAGNRWVLGRPIRLAIDLRETVDPNVRPERGRSIGPDALLVRGDDPVRLTASSGVAVAADVTGDGAGSGVIVDVDSTGYYDVVPPDDADPPILGGRADDIVEYRLRSWTPDAFGRYIVGRPMTIVFDRRLPPTVGVHVHKLAAADLVSFPQYAEFRYRLAIGPAGGEVGPADGEVGPFLVASARRERSVIVTVDSEGTTRRVVSTVSADGNPEPPPEVTLPADIGAPVVLPPGAGDEGGGYVYQIVPYRPDAPRAADLLFPWSAPPQAVDPNEESGEPQVSDLTEGEFEAALGYVVGGGTAVSVLDSRRYRFDTVPPGTPRVLSPPSGAYFDGPTTVEVDPTGARTILSVRTVTGLVDSIDDREVDATVVAYDAPVRFEGRRGASVTYEVRSYSFDEAGNRSSLSEPVVFQVDRSSIWVSPAGDDSAAGGKLNPVATIPAAIERAIGSGRGEIHLLPGEYEVVAGRRVDGDEFPGGLTIVGEPGDSSARPVLRLRSGSTAEYGFNVIGGRVSFSGIQVTGDLPLRAALRVGAGAVLSLDAVDVAMSSASGLIVEGGTATVAGGGRVATELGLPGVVVTGGTARISGATVAVESADRRAEATAVRASGGGVLVLENAQVTVSGAGGATGIFVIGGVALLSETALEVEAWGGLGYGIRTEESVVTIGDSSLSIDTRTGTALGVSLRGGDAVVEHTDIAVRGDLGATGVVGRSVHLACEDTSITVDSDRGFAVGLLLRDASSTLQSLSVSVGAIAPADAEGIVIRGGSVAVSWVGVDVAGRRRSAVGLRLEDGGNLSGSGLSLRHAGSAGAGEERTALRFGASDIRIDVSGVEVEGWNLLVRDEEGTPYLTVAEVAGEFKTEGRSLDIRVDR